LVHNAGILGVRLINADEVFGTHRRQRLPHLSFFAFTATPKTKTLEVFGKRGERGIRAVAKELVSAIRHHLGNSDTAF
jgi:hypothetical protein